MWKIIYKHRLLNDKKLSNYWLISHPLFILYLFIIYINFLGNNIYIQYLLRRTSNQ